MLNRIHKAYVHTHLPKAAVSVLVWRPVYGGIPEVRTDTYLLVKRGNEPAKGKWSLPGGSITFGETIQAAAKRELREETNIRPDDVKWRTQPFMAVDMISHSEAGSVEHHYVIVQMLCKYLRATPLASPGDDATDLGWYTYTQIKQMEIEGKISGTIHKVIEEANIHSEDMCMCADALLCDYGSGCLCTGDNIRIRRLHILTDMHTANITYESYLLDPDPVD